MLIKVNPKIAQIQQQDMKTIEKLIGQIKDAEEQNDVFVQSAIAVGYANAMQAHKVITEGELKRLNAMIGTIAERRLAEVQKIGRTRFFRTFLRFGKVGAHGRTTESTGEGSLTNEAMQNKKGSPQTAICGDPVLSAIQNNYL